MVRIKTISEPIVALWKQGELIGTINSELQLIDILVQITEEQTNGYYVKYKGNEYNINKNGRVIGLPVYNLYSMYIRKLIKTQL